MNEVIVAQDDPRQAAKKLALHSFWARLAFCGTILVAVGLHSFDRALIGVALIENDDGSDLACRFGSYCLAALDLALLVDVVGKQALRLLRVI
jgi:hypothetical protein